MCPTLTVKGFVNKVCCPAAPLTCARRRRTWPYPGSRRPLLAYSCPAFGSTFRAVWQSCSAAGGGRTRAAGSARSMPPPAAAFRRSRTDSRIPADTVDAAAIPARYPPRSVRRRSATQRVAPGRLAPAPHRAESAARHPEPSGIPRGTRPARGGATVCPACAAALLFWSPVRPPSGAADPAPFHCFLRGVRVLTVELCC